MFKRRSILVTVMCLGLAFSACEKEGGAGEKKRTKAELVKEATDLKDAACACKDAACGDRVLGEFVAWVKGQENELHVMTPAEEKSFEAMGMELGLCLVKAGVDPEKLANL